MTHLWVPSPSPNGAPALSLFLPGLNLLLPILVCLKGKVIGDQLTPTLPLILVILSYGLKEKPLTGYYHLSVVSYC